MQIVMLAYPGMTQLDLTGPFEVFGRFPEFKIDLVWKNAGLVADGSGLKIHAGRGFDDCPQADILFVPGGPGQTPLMDDIETLAFLRHQAAGAAYVTSVCTGSLLLAAAGLLTGYRATCHWLSLPQLALFGVEPVAERVVFDRNRVTGAGVTSGIDFALALAGHVFGEARARRAQLSMEYDPHPPYSGGSPASADPTLVGELRQASSEWQARREAASKRAAERLRSGSRLPAS